MGSARLRYETLSGQARAGISAHDDLVSIRTHLFTEYKTGAFRFGADLYDSRAYDGDAAGSVGANDVNALEFLQLYTAVDLGTPFDAGVKTKLQAGRFVLNLGSRRLAAGDDYRNTMNGFTGLRADLAAPNGVSATLIYTLPQTRLPDDKPSVLKNKVKFDRENFDLVFWGGIASKTRTIGDAMLEFSYFHLDEDDAPLRPTRDRNLDTMSVRVINDPHAAQFDYELEGIYQFGHVSAGLAPTAARLDVSAWFAHADAGYTWPGAWTPRLSLEVDYASGDKPGGSFNRFDTLFGMRRADLAPSAIYGAVGRANILTPGIRLETVPSKRWDWFAAYRLMWLASPTDSFSTSGVVDPTGASGRFAGSQLESRVRYWVVPDTLQFEVDAIGLFKGRQLKAAPNAPNTGDTAYLSLNVTTFF